MATKNEYSDFDFNDGFDFNFDLDDGSGGFQSAGKKSKARRAVEDLTGSYVSGMKDRIFSKETQRKYIQKGLPESYSTAYDGAFEIKDGISDIYDAASDGLGKVHDKLRRGAGPLLDKFESKLPNRFRTPLRNWANKARPVRNMTKEDRESLEAMAVVSEIFANKENNELNKENVAQAKVANVMRMKGNELTQLLAKNSQKQIAYQEQIDANWKKKTLELQYRQYYVQRKMLDTNEKLLSLSEQSFKDLVKNTALPDFVKMQNQEWGRKILMESMVGKVVNGWGKNTRGLINKMTKSAVKNTQVYFNNMAGMVDDIAGTAQMASDTMGGDMGMSSREEKIGSHLQSFTGGYLLDFLFNKFGGEKLKDNKKVIEWSKKLQMGMNFGKHKLQDLAHYGSDIPAIEALINFFGLKEHLGGAVKTVKLSDLDRLEEAAYYDVLSRKTLTEIIPGYLGRIHWELRALRTGEVKHGVMMYDFKRGKFSVDKQIIRDMKKDIMGDSQERAKRAVDEFYSKMNLDGLSSEARDAIISQAALAAFNGTSFNFHDLMDPDNDRYENINYAIKDEISEWLKTNHGFKDFTHPDNDGVWAKAKSAYNKAMGTRIGASQQAVNAELALTEMIRQMGNIKNPTGVARDYTRMGYDKLLAGMSFFRRGEGGGTSLYQNAFAEAIFKTKFGDDNNYYLKDGTILDKKEIAAYQKYGSDYIPDYLFDWVSTNKDKKVPAPDKKYEKKDYDSDIKGLRKFIKDNDGNEGGPKGKGFSQGGYTGDFHPKMPVGIVHGGEYVFTAQDVKNIGLEQLEKIRKWQWRDAGRVARDTLAGTADGRVDEAKEKVKKWLETAKTDEVKQRSDDLLIEITARLKKATGSDKLSAVNFREAHRKDPRLQDVVNRYTTLRSLVDKKKNDFGYESVLNRLDVTLDKVLKGYSKLSGKDTWLANKVNYYKAGKLKISDWWTDAKNKMKDKAYITGESIKDMSAYRLDFGLGTTSYNGDVSAPWMGKLLLDIGKQAVGLGAAYLKPLKTVPTLGKIVGRVLKKTLFSAVNFNHVVYGLWIKGDPEPKMIKDKLDQGIYLNGDFKPIKGPGDIQGTIYDSSETDEQGNPKIVLLEKEYKGGLFDARGKFIAKPKGLLGKLKGKAVKGMKKLMRFGVKSLGKYFQGTFWVSKKLVQGVTLPYTFMVGLLDKATRDPEGDIQHKYLMAAHSAGVQAQVNTTQAIVSVGEKIDEYFGPKEKVKNDSDGDGDRDGNALDKLNEKRIAAQEKFKEKAKSKVKEFVEKKKEENGLIGKIISGISWVGSTVARLAIPVLGGLLSAVIGKMTIPALLRWLAGEYDDPIDPNDPRMDPNSPVYDPDFGKPTMVNKAAKWGLEKWEGMSGWEQLAAGGIGMYGAGKVFKGAKWGLGKLAGLTGKGIMAAGKGTVKAFAKGGVTRNLMGKAGQALFTTAGRQGLMAGAKGLAGRAVATKVGGAILTHGGRTAVMGALSAKLAASGGVAGLLASTPIGWAVAATIAIGAVGYLGYKLYKNYTEESFMFRLRMTSYGIDPKDEDLCAKALDVESILVKDATVDNKGRIHFPNLKDKDVQEAFGVTPDDKENYQKYTEYLVGRFMPVFQMFALAKYTITKDCDVTTMDEDLDFKDMQKILKHLMWRPGMTEVNPYEVMVCGFPGHDEVDMDKDDVYKLIEKVAKRINTFVKEGRVNEAMKADKKEAKKMKSEEASAAKKEALAKNSSEHKTKDFNNRAINNSFKMDASTMAPGTQPGSAGGWIKDKMTQLWEKFLGSGGHPANGANGTGDAADAGAMAGGVVGELLTNGTGGTIANVPQPTGNGWRNNKATIVAAAQMVGIDPGLAAGMAAQESGFQPSVKSGSSSATGLFQFISDTWNSMMRQYGAKYGIPAGTPATNGAANAILGAQYLKDNIQAMSRILGAGKVQPGDAYLAHFAGTGGARRALRAGDNAPISAGFGGEQIRANPGIFGGTRTIGDVRRKLTQKMVTAHREHGVDIPIGGGGSLVTAGTGNTASASSSSSSGGSTSSKSTKPKTGANSVLKNDSKTKHGQVTRTPANVAKGTPQPTGTNSVLRPSANSTTSIAQNTINSRIDNTIAGRINTSGVTNPDSPKDASSIPAASKTQNMMAKVTEIGTGISRMAGGGKATPAGIVTAATGDSSFDVNKFINTLRRNGKSSSSGYCAKFVRLALNAAGVAGSGGGSAYMYANWLPTQGFNEISMNSGYQAGDIVVNAARYNGRSAHGHIQGYTGAVWISDFIQNRLETRSARLFRHKSLTGQMPVVENTGMSDSTVDNAGASGPQRSKYGFTFESKSLRKTSEIEYIDNGQVKAGKLAGKTAAKKVDEINKDKKEKNKIKEATFKNATGVIDGVDGKAKMAKLPYVYNGAKVHPNENKMSQVNMEKAKESAKKIQESLDTGAVIEYKPDGTMVVAKASDTATVERANKPLVVNTKPIQEAKKEEDKKTEALMTEVSKQKASEKRTQTLIVNNAKKTNTEIENGNEILKHQLAMQTEMRDLLKSIDNKILSMGRGVTNSNTSNSKSNSKQTNKSNTKKTYTAPKTPKKEPMSMSK